MKAPSKIFLVGMPGSGKSTVGKALADTLKYKFIDLDDVVEGKANMKIADIFETKGEDYFRELEALSLTEVANNTSEVVVATGGGAPCFHDGMDYINNSGYSVYLSVSLETLIARLSEASHRPLVNAMEEDTFAEGIKEKLSNRESFYEKSSITVPNDNRSVLEVVADITRQFA